MPPEEVVNYLALEPEAVVDEHTAVYGMIADDHYVRLDHRDLGLGLGRVLCHHCNRNRTGC